MNISNNKILITGGATGIGFGLAERFLKEDNTVIICGRRKSVLKEVSDKYPSIIIRQCDLAKANEREDLFSWILKEHNDLNVLINNAGVQQRASIFEGDFLQRAKEEISINVEAPMHLISLFIKLKSIHTIMNVTSGLAFVPIVRMPVYCATKSCLHSFTLSMRELLKSKNMEVIEIIPPALNTDLGGKGVHANDPPVSTFIDAIFEQLKAGKTELTNGFSDAMLKAGPEDLQKIFVRMNSSR